MFSASKAVGSFLLACGIGFSAAPKLRVCADPNNLPYSNEKQQGFENKLADMIGKDLGEQIVYTWYPQRGKFFRRTLDAGICDVVMGMPEGMAKTAITRPYYQSSYVFVSRADRNLRINSFDDPQLRTLRIGIHVLGEGDDNLPPVHSLVTRGIVKNLVGFSIFGNLEETNPSSNLVRAVIDKSIDVAVAWGPLAGYFSLNSAVPLAVTPISRDPANPNLPLAFAIGLGLRAGDDGLKRQLDAEIERRKPEIHALLHSYGIPQKAE